MKGNDLLRNVKSFGLAFFVAAIANSMLVILKEENEGVMAWMKALTGHHWITQGVFAVVLFFLLGMVFSLTGIGEKLEEERLSVLALTGALAATLLIVGFFLL
ncbi:hypothetical protein EG833_01210 [archaeon]|nr:hypothetical protein [archaeon]